MGVVSRKEKNVIRYPVANLFRMMDGGQWIQTIGYSLSKLFKIHKYVSSKGLEGEVEGVSRLGDSALAFGLRL